MKLSEYFIKEMQCEEAKFEKSEDEDVTVNEERLMRSDPVIDIVASSIIRLSDIVLNSESVPESVRMNGKTYHVVENQKDWEEKLDNLNKCINSDKPLLPNEIKPILLVNPEMPEDSYFYVPIATDAQSPPRGIYLKVDTTRKDTQPIGSFITASCLFGSKTLVGIDAAGKQYPLLDTTKNPVPEGVCIIEVRVLNETHTYECAMWETDEIIVPFIKQHKNAEPIVIHLLADVEYYLYGLTYLVGGIFSREAFEQYITAVNVRVAKHKEKMSEIYAGSGIKLNFNVNSPFRNLDLSGKSAEKVIDRFVELFSDKGVNTLEDLCSNITRGDITLNDLLIKLKETFNSDPAIAACEDINQGDQQIIRSMKAQQIATKSDPDGSVCSILDQLAEKQRAFNMDKQTKLNPWRLENFEPEVRNLVEGKEKDPTPSQMFSIVSTISEVARVMMSVIQNRNKLVSLIFESQQEKTLKKFKELFKAHSKKICAYTYQLPIATQDRPLFHVEDCPAVNETFIFDISRLCYLNGEMRDKFESEMNGDLIFYNCHYDKYLLSYIGSHHSIDIREPVTGSGIPENKQELRLNGILEFFEEIIETSISRMRYLTKLTSDDITYEQILIMLTRLVKFVVSAKFREFDQANSSKDPRVFYYTDSDTVSVDYKKNGPGVEEFHMRNIFQFSADGPLLDKEKRISLLKNLSLLEYVNNNDSDTKLAFRFRSGVMLSLLRLSVMSRKNVLSQNDLFLPYIDLVLAIHEIDGQMEVGNLFTKKMQISTLLAASENKADLANKLRDFVKKLGNFVDLEPILICNLINIATELDSFTLSTILGVCNSFFYYRKLSDNESQGFSEFLQFPGKITLWGPESKNDKVTISPMDVRNFRGQYIITTANECSSRIEFGDRYICILGGAITGYSDPKEPKQLYNKMILDKAVVVIKEYVRMSKKISIENDCDITLYIENAIIDYVKLCPGRDAKFISVYRKKVGIELEMLSFVYSKEQVCSERWLPISRLVNQVSYKPILSEGVLCNTFLKIRKTKEEIRLLPKQVFLGCRVDGYHHASLYMHWLDERGVPCIETIEIGVCKSDLEYCKLLENKRYSESTSEQHLREAFDCLLEGKVKTRWSLAGTEIVKNKDIITPQNLLSKIRWGCIISLSERAKLKEYIKKMFYKSSSQGDKKLLYPFYVAGKDSVATLFRTKKRMEKESKNFYGEEMTPINCFDFCREAVVATGNPQAKKDFHENFWFVKKIINEPVLVPKTIKVVKRFFPSPTRQEGAQQSNSDQNPSPSPNPNKLGV